MAGRRHPYEGLPPRAFWRSGVAEADPAGLAGLYAPKWRIGPGDRLATAGSCFARHVGRRLRRQGFAVLDAEPPPDGLPSAEHVRHDYGVFSARTGNIYTMRQLRQLAEEAAGDRRPLDPVWERDGRSVDALRPAVDPDGLPTDAAVGAARARHLAAVRRLLAEMDVLVFTLGLAETFADRRDGTVFPSAPGVVAGRYDPGRHVLLTLTCRDIVEDFAAFRERVVALRGGRSFRTLLSVSPVPLAATAGGGHILSANAGAKATLRAAAGELAAADETIDYVPAFEIVTNPAARGAFTDATFRDVTEAGVAAVMAAFLAAHDAPAEAAPADLDDAACEEALAAAFGR